VENGKQTSGEDRQRFDDDPDPTDHFNADSDPDIHVGKNFLQVKTKGNEFHILSVSFYFVYLVGCFIPKQCFIIT
jgi:hypothetical protein